MGFCKSGVSYQGASISGRNRGNLWTYFCTLFFIELTVIFQFFLAFNSELIFPLPQGNKLKTKKQNKNKQIKPNKTSSTNQPQQTTPQKNQKQTPPQKKTQKTKKRTTKQKNENKNKPIKTKKTNNNSNKTGKEEKLKKYQWFLPRLSNLVVNKTAFHVFHLQSQHFLQVIPLLQSKNKLLSFLAALVTSHLWIQSSLILACVCREAETISSRDRNCTFHLSQDSVDGAIMQLIN